MRSRRIFAVLAGAAMTVTAAVAFVPSSMAAVSSADAVPMVACTAPAWAEGPTYQAGAQVTYGGRLYQALVTHTAHPGAGWNPAATPSLWRDLGACSGSTPPPTTPRRRRPQPPTDAPPTTPPPTTPPPTGGTCAVKSRPSRQGVAGVLGELGRRLQRRTPRPRLDPDHRQRLNQHGYNVINAAFPVIRVRRHGAVGERHGRRREGRHPGRDVPGQSGRRHHPDVDRRAAAGIDLSSSAVADRFVATIVPILTAYNFDGIDIDIETGLTGSGNINTLSTSQANLIRIIDGVLARMPSNFGLTMAPETAYVTGGSVIYGSIWGSYLPIIKKYVDNGRLWWLNMQYYNGSMYGCAGDSYPAGTVQGFTVQTQCLNNGLTIQGTTIRVPYDKQVPGLPAQIRRRRRPHVDVAGHAGLELRTRPQGPDDLVGNWDGSKGWTFGDNVKRLQGR